MRRKDVDWDAVRSMYCEGDKSLRELGQLFNVSHIAISKRAKHGGWYSTATPSHLDALRRDYCLSAMSLREIGGVHGLNPGTVYRKASRFGWIREHSDAPKGMKDRPRVQKNKKDGAPRKETAPARRLSRGDWEAIEVDFLAGALTLRELAAKHSISHTAIKRKADKLGWRKPSTPDVPSWLSQVAVGDVLADGDSRWHVVRHIASTASLGVRITVLEWRPKSGRPFVRLSAQQMTEAGFHLLSGVRDPLTSPINQVIQSSLAKKGVEISSSFVEAIA